MNPFLVRDRLPDFYSIKPKHVIPAINKVINENLKVISEVESMSESPSWMNFVTPLEICSERLNRVWSYINHINAVKSSTSSVSYTHLRAHETLMNLVCRLLLEKNMYAWW